MSHGLEQFGDLTSFVSARELPWHRLGTVVDHAMTAEEALKLAHLAGWNVRKEPLFTRVGTQDLEVENKFAIVRDNPFVRGQVDVFDVVGGVYSVIQNEDTTALADAITDESGAHYETAGSLRGGREVFVSMKLPDTMNIGGKDPVDTYLTIVNTHDGTKALRVIVTNVRVVCWNTLNAALRNNDGIFSLRHTAGNGGAAARARETLALGFKYVQDFEAEAEKMIQQEMNNREFDRLVASLWPIKDDDSELVSSRLYEHREKTRQLFESSPTSTEIKGTNWAAYQAVTEYLDHFSPVPGQHGSGAQDARAEKILSGKMNKFKERAFQLTSV